MTTPTTQTSMQTFGDFLNTLTPELLKKYEEHKKEREEKNAENAVKYREKYGFVPNDFDIGRIERVEAENAICATCEGLPCKKSQNLNWQSLIKADSAKQRIDIFSKRCKYAETAKLQKSIERNFRLSQIPAKYIGKTFEDYVTDKSNIDALNAAKEFAKNLQHGLILHGKPGRGKTFLAAITAQEVLKQGKSAIFGDVPSMLEDLRSNYSKNNDNRLEEQMKALAKADLVVLDDIGTEKPTEWAVNRLYLVVNDRYNANKPLIVTSNYTSKEIAERLNKPTDAKSAGVTGDRIVSRIMEMCEVFSIRGEDRRLKK